MKILYIYQYVLLATFLVSSCKDSSSVRPENDKEKGGVKIEVENLVARRMVERLENGETTLVEKQFKEIDDGSQWRTLEKTYDLLGDNKSSLRGLISLQSKVDDVPRQFSLKLYKEFINMEVPKEFIIPGSERGWGGSQSASMSDKYLLAKTIVRSANQEIIEKLWDEFPNQSLANQNVLAMAASSSDELKEVDYILKASESAKSEEVRVSLLDAGNRVVLQALKNTETRVEAERLVKELHEKNMSRPLLDDYLRDAL